MSCQLIDICSLTRVDLEAAIHEISYFFGEPAWVLRTLLDGRELEDDGQFIVIEPRRLPGNQLINDAADTPDVRESVEVNRVLVLPDQLGRGPVDVIQLGTLERHSHRADLLDLTKIG